MNNVWGSGHVWNMLEFMVNLKTFNWCNLLNKKVASKWLKAGVEVSISDSTRYPIMQRSTLGPKAIYGNWNPFENDEKYFFISCCPGFLPRHINGLMGKLRLIKLFDAIQSQYLR